MSDVAVVNLLKDLLEDEKEAYILELISQGITPDQLLKQLLDEHFIGDE
jgi:DNA-binding CsgD family transcriptional regulator